MTEITIVHKDGSTIVDLDGEHFVEETMRFEDSIPAIRVWHEDPEFDDDAYTDYIEGTIIEVDP